MVYIKSKKQNPHTGYDKGILKVLPCLVDNKCPSFSTMHMPIEILHNEMPALFIPKG